MKTLVRERDMAEILGRLRRVRPDSVRRWGCLSAHQMVCHLADNCRMALGEKPVRSSGGVAQRTIVKWIALYAPVRWPAGIRTSPEVDQERGGTRPTRFAEDLAQAEALLELLRSAGRRLEQRPHPVFGPMSAAAWLRAAYLHTDHHLRQFGA